MPDRSHQWRPDRARRDRLHDGVWRVAIHQLRARRPDHARRLCGAHAGRAVGAGTDGNATDGRHLAPHRGPGASLWALLRGAERGGRPACLPAVAECSGARPVGIGHRCVVYLHEHRAGLDRAGRPWISPGASGGQPPAWQGRAVWLERSACGGGGRATDRRHHDADAGDAAREGSAGGGPGSHGGGACWHRYRSGRGHDLFSRRLSGRGRQRRRESLHQYHRLPDGLPERSLRAHRRGARRAGQHSRGRGRWPGGGPRAGTLHGLCR